MKSKEPIIKNGYVMALLVFFGLVIAFNVADSYSNSYGNEVTGYAAYSSFGNIGTFLNTITDFIFRGILQDTVIQSFFLYGDIIIRLIIFIILYFIISSVPTWISSIGERGLVERGLVKHEKHAKIISALIALVAAVFIPQDVIFFIFGTPASPGLLGGGLGLAIWAIFIFLPLYLLFTWLKSTKDKDRFIRFLTSFLFLGWFFVINAIEGRIYVSAYLVDVWDILLSFGSLAAIVGFFLGIWKGFSMKSKSSRKSKNQESNDFINRGGIKGDWERTKGHLRGIFKGRELTKLAMAAAADIAKKTNNNDKFNRYRKYLSTASSVGISKKDADDELIKYLPSLPRP